MTYLLDTNACIAIINNHPRTVRVALQQALDDGHQGLLSSVSVFELWYGVAKSNRVEFNTRRLHSFLESPLLPLGFDHEDARAAGSIRAQLKSIGKPMGAYDLLIAGQALRHNFILVTANVREFANVAELQWEDWS